MEDQLQAVLDKSAIEDVLGRYVRAIDRLDWELLRSCYHSDATEDRGRYCGGIDGFIEWVRGTLEQLESTWHLIGAPTIELKREGLALVETYCLAIQRAAPSEPEARLIPCRYCDRFERRDGDWRIAHRIAVYETPCLLLSSSAPAVMGAMSRRDRQDPGYGGGFK